MSFTIRNISDKRLRGLEKYSVRHYDAIIDGFAQARASRLANSQNAAFAAMDRNRAGFEPDSPVVQQDSHAARKDSPSYQDESESDFDEHDTDSCQRCGLTHYKRKNNSMILCSNDECKQMVHQKCHIPVLTRVPEGPFYCGPDCEAAAKVASSSRNRDESYTPNRRLKVDDLADLVDAKRSCLLMATQKALVEKLKYPIKFLSMSVQATSNINVTVDVFQQLGQCLCANFESAGMPLHDGQRSVLEKMAPPVNIRRSLRDLGSCDLQTAELEYEFPKKGIVAYFQFHYRCPLSAALDLYESYAIRAVTPVFRWDSEEYCTCSGRLPALKPYIERMAKSQGFDLSKCVVFPVVLYCDESASSSGNVLFNPLWMHPAGIDVDAREIWKMVSHSIVAFLPVMSHIQFRPGPEFQGNAGDAESLVSDDEKREAYRELKLLALRTFFEEWKRSEGDGGFPCNIDGCIVQFRPALFGMVTDMQERREHLCLRRGSTYHCSACYNFPGKNLPEEDKLKIRGEIMPKGLRSTKADAELRNEVFGNVTLTTREKKEAAFKDNSIKHGLMLYDTCPLSAYEESKIYVPRHPSSVFRPDSLHLKNGVITYYCRYVDAKVNSKLISQSKLFGNVYLATGKYHMHVMEQDIESFHTIPLTLAFGNFGVELSPEQRCELYTGACDLLLILGLLTDPCPKMVKGKLSKTIESFERHIKEALGEEGTPKMHELFAHMMDAIDVAGHSEGFSSKVHETLHQYVKQLYVSSSHRTNGVFKEMLWSSFHRMTFDNVSAFDNLRDCLPAPDEPFHPATKFRIVNSEFVEGPLNTQIAQSFKAVFKRVVGAKMGNQPLVLPPFEGFRGETRVFGNALEASLVCTKRQVNICSSKTFRVLYSDNEMRAGGMIPLLAYASDDWSLDGAACSNSCKDPRCRFRKPEINLFCSASRDTTTLHGFPILFVDQSVVLWPLDRVDSAESILPSEHDAIIEYRCVVPDQLIVIPFSKIRGECLLKCPNPKLFGVDDRGFVFTGRDVFGY